MSYPLNIYARHDTLKPDPEKIFGPYSLWPRKPRRFGRNAVLAGSVGTLAVFVHCVVPLVA